MSLWSTFQRWLKPVVEGPGLGERLIVNDEGWVVGFGMIHAPAHPSWYYQKLSTENGEPIANMLHYTVTSCGTAKPMAKRRQRKRKANDRAASWHFSIECNGYIWQQISVLSGAWHCSRGRVQGHRVNKSVVGIELVSKDGTSFPDRQMSALARLTDALTDTFEIPAHLALLYHSDFDPKRREDPGPVFDAQHKQPILDAIYADGMADTP